MGISSCHRPVAALLLVLAVAAPAAADKKLKIAVLDVRAVGQILSPEARDGVAGLTNLVTKTVADSDKEGLSVISSADIRTMIGFEKQKELLGCAEASCLAEIGGALGVDFIVSTEVAEVGGTYLVSLALVSVSRGKAAGRLTRRLQFFEQVVDATGKGVTDLLAQAKARESEPPGKRNMKVAVMDVKASGLSGTGSVEGLAALVASEVAARDDVQVTTGADIRAVMGFEKQRQLVGCDEATCLAEIGGALGVDFIISTEVSKVGDEWILALSMVNIKKAQATNRVVSRVKKAEMLVDNAIYGVKELFFDLSGAKAGGDQTLVGKYVQPTRSLGFGLALVGTGLVLGGVGAVLEVDALAVQARDQQAKDQNDPEGRATPEQAAQALRNNGVAIGLWVGGGAVMLYGLYDLLFRDDVGAGPSVQVGPSSGGASATFSIPLP